MNDKITEKELKEAYKKAGYRERHAMDHGEAKVVHTGGRRCICFSLPEDDEHQNANGALYDADNKKWVN